MHCVSSYPCNPENVNMPKLQILKEHFKHVGYSGHFAGIDDALMAFVTRSRGNRKTFYY